jgi:hypothetical protein
MALRFAIQMLTMFFADGLTESANPLFTPNAAGTLNWSPSANSTADLEFPSRLFART